MKRRFFPPRLIIPATFTDCLTYEQQLLWLLMHKSNVLKAGDNITLTENDDDTITISAEGGGSEYTIQKTTSEGVDSYKLLDEDGVQHGDTIVVPPGHSYTIHEYEDEESVTLYELLDENGERCGDAIVMQDPDLDYRIEKEEDEMYDIYRLMDKYGDEHGDDIEVPHVPEIHDYTIEGEQDVETGGWDYQLLEDDDPVGDTIHVPGPELPAGGDNGQVLKVVGNERDIEWGFVNGNTVYPRTEIMYHKYEAGAKEIVDIDRHSFSEESGFGIEISNDGNDHYTITFNDEGTYRGMVLRILNFDEMITFDDPTDKNAYSYPFVGDYVQFWYNVQVTTTPVSIGFTLDNGGVVLTDYYYELERYGGQLLGGGTYDVLMKNSPMAGDYMWQSPYVFIKDLCSYVEANGDTYSPFHHYTTGTNTGFLFDPDETAMARFTLKQDSNTSFGLLGLKKIRYPECYKIIDNVVTQVTPEYQPEILLNRDPRTLGQFDFNIGTENLSIFGTTGKTVSRLYTRITFSDMWLKDISTDAGRVQYFTAQFMGQVVLEYHDTLDHDHTRKLDSVINMKVSSSAATGTEVLTNIDVLEPFTFDSTMTLDKITVHTQLDVT